MPPFYSHKIAYLDLLLQWLHIVDNFIKHYCLTSDLKQSIIPQMSIGLHRLETGLNRWARPPPITLLHPGTSSWSNLIRSLIFSLLTWKQATKFNRKKSPTFYILLFNQRMYPFCKAVTISSLTPFGSHMNILFRSLST